MKDVYVFCRPQLGYYVSQLTSTGDMQTLYYVSQLTSTGDIQPCIMSPN
jgi:hypothetical protein